jgi:hypothetical protein
MPAPGLDGCPLQQGKRAGDARGQQRALSSPAPRLGPRIRFPSPPAALRAHRPAPPPGARPRPGPPGAPSSHACLGRPCAALPPARRAPPPRGPRPRGTALRPPPGMGRAKAPALAAAAVGGLRAALWPAPPAGAAGAALAAAAAGGLRAAVWDAPAAGAALPAAAAAFGSAPDPAAAAPVWLPPAAFAARLEPYKRVGGVLIREDCCSLAASNPYHNLAEVKVGGVMLRAGGRVPARATQLLVRKAVPPKEICGWVIGEARARVGPPRALAARELVSDRRWAQRRPGGGGGSSGATHSPCLMTPASHPRRARPGPRSMRTRNSGARAAGPRARRNARRAARRAARPPSRRPAAAAVLARRVRSPRGAQLPRRPRRRRERRRRRRRRARVQRGRRHAAVVAGRARRAQHVWVSAAPV